MNSAFLKQIEEENRILEQELQQLLKQEAVRFSFSQKTKQFDQETSDENTCPNYQSDKADLSKIDEETEEEQPHKIEPQRLLESPSKPGSIIDNLTDSINNFMEKRSGSVVDNCRNSQKSVEFSNKQIKSLEMRLAGTREAMKSLEKEVKEKNIIIQNLQIDLAKKQKQIDILSKNNSSANLSTSTKSDNNGESFQELKKQYKDLEKKFIDNENFIKENKKYSQRLQELNQQLLFKLKQYENGKDNQINELNEISNSLVKYENTIQSLQEQTQQQNDKYRQLEKKYDELKLNSEQFLINSRDLKSQYEHMLNTLQSLANNY